MSTLYHRAAGAGDPTTYLAPEGGIVHVPITTGPAGPTPPRHEAPLPLTLRQMGLLTKDEVSALLQVTVATLALWRSKKKGPPYVRLGTRVFYVLEGLQNWIDGKSADYSHDHHAPEDRSPGDAEHERQQNKNKRVGNVADIFAVAGASQPAS
jgi:hypothetical protein